MRARRPGSQLLTWLVGAVVVLIAGCQSSDPMPDASAGTAAGPALGVPGPEDIDPARLEPLEGLPACPPPPDPVEGETGGLPLPTEAVVTLADVDQGLQSVRGFTPRTPVEVIFDYLGLEDWSVLTAEDEVFESELLLERDGLRVFVKAQANCSRGSTFLMFGSRDPALVPAPTGAGPDARAEHSPRSQPQRGVVGSNPIASTL